MTLNPNLKPNLYEISWNCKIVNLCLGQLMNTTLLISNLRQMRTYATAITACSVGKERSYLTCKSKITMWWSSVTLLGWTILLATTELNGVRSPVVTKSDFYVEFRVQTVFVAHDSWVELSDPEKVFGFWATSCLLEILIGTILFRFKAPESDGEVRFDDIRYLMMLTANS